MDIIGNSKIVQYFIKALDSGGLSHAYCFSGVDGIGKKKLAYSIASKILSVDIDKVYLHPDFNYLEREINEKTDVTKQRISIEQVRALKNRISVKSWVAPYNIVVIDEAELLNDASGNGLLRQLEESEGKTIFFLLTTDDNSMLPTIKSRCQTFYFSTVSEKEMKKGLKKFGCDKDVETATKLSWGRPGRAIQILESSEMKDEYLNEYKRWQKIVGSPFCEKIKHTEDLFSKKKSMNKDKLIELFDVWTVLWRGIMRNVVKGEEVKLRKQYSAKEIGKIIDLFNESKKMLHQNINKNLIIENILLTI